MLITEDTVKIDDETVSQPLSLLRDQAMSPAPEEMMTLCPNRCQHQKATATPHRCIQLVR